MPKNRSRVNKTHLKRQKLPFITKIRFFYLIPPKHHAACRYPLFCKLHKRKNKSVLPKFNDQGGCSLLLYIFIFFVSLLLFNPINADMCVALDVEKAENQFITSVLYLLHVYPSYGNPFYSSFPIQI